VFTPQPKKPDHLIGCDLAQASDFSAVVGLERSWHKELMKTRSGPHFVEVAHYLLGHLHRWPLKTSYPQIVSDVCDLVKRPPFSRPALVVDQTGVGAPVVDMLRAANPAAIIKPMLITSGHTTKSVDGVWHVPKKELVSILQTLLQSGRLKFSNVPDRELLVKELLAFKVKVTTAGNETFEAWRERDHDDLVLATALAVWVGEKFKPVKSFAPHSAGGNSDLYLSGARPVGATIVPPWGR